MKLCEKGSPSLLEKVQKLQCGGNHLGGKEQETSQERRIGEGDKSLGQRAPKGHSSLGSHNHRALPYQDSLGKCFTGYTKQLGSKWLKICLLGLFLKELDV